MKNKETKVNFTMRVEKSLKDIFVKICKTNDDDASKVIRRMMREYVKENQQRGIGGLL